ncbi:MAG: PEGA domain-containing protein [Ignavibacteriaceae bacterium]|nr:PEGA domain-containing protein [Ignavibacteriaceae bacterium]
MNKKYYVLPLILILGLCIASCKSNSNNPVTTNPVGTISVHSDPSGAQIWLDGVNTGKTTPDSLINIKTGSHTISLVLSNYIDTSAAFVITVSDGVNAVVERTLVIDASITVLGPVQIWESADPNLNHQGGIILKSGSAAVLDSAGRASVDIFYSSNGYVIASAQTLNNNTGRNTFFFESLFDSLNDGVASPVKIDIWASNIFDTEIAYFYLYDADMHYSKMVITDRGGTHGSAVDPAWVKVKWLYNNKPNDVRFYPF